MISFFKKKKTVYLKNGQTIEVNKQTADVLAKMMVEHESSGKCYLVEFTNQDDCTKKSILQSPIFDVREIAAIN